MRFNKKKQQTTFCWAVGRFNAWSGKKKSIFVSSTAQNKIGQKRLPRLNVTEDSDGWLECKQHGSHICLRATDDDAPYRFASAGILNVIVNITRIDLFCILCFNYNYNIYYCYYDWFQ